eukprot:XP_001693418.1 magnesium and cobalt transport protein [Chlamydomonas reinhardtii]
MQVERKLRREYRGRVEVQVVDYCLTAARPRLVRWSNYSDGATGMRALRGFLDMPRPVLSLLEPQIRWVKAEGFAWDLVKALAGRYNLPPLLVSDLLGVENTEVLENFGAGSGVGGSGGGSSDPGPAPGGAGGFDGTSDGILYISMPMIGLRTRLLLRSTIQQQQAAAAAARAELDPAPAPIAAAAAGPTVHGARVKVEAAGGPASNAVSRALEATIAAAMRPSGGGFGGMPVAEGVEAPLASDPAAAAVASAAEAASTAGNTGTGTAAGRHHGAGGVGVGVDVGVAVGSGDVGVSSIGHPQHHPGHVHHHGHGGQRRSSELQGWGSVASGGSVADVGVETDSPRSLEAWLRWLRGLCRCGRPPSRGRKDAGLWQRLMGVRRSRDDEYRYEKRWVEEPLVLMLVQDKAVHGATPHAPPNLPVAAGPAIAAGGGGGGGGHGTGARGVTLISVFHYSGRSVTYRLWRQITSGATGSTAAAAAAAAAVRRSDAGYLLYLIMRGAVDQAYDVVRDFYAQLSEFERRVRSGNLSATATEQLHVMSTDLQLLDRRFKATITVLRLLTTKDAKDDSGTLTDAPMQLSANTQAKIKALVEQVRGISDEIDSLGTQASQLTDLVFNLIAHRSNNSMRVLSIISTVFLPITFLAGVYGTNFDNLPELHWQLGVSGDGMSGRS